MCTIIKDRIVGQPSCVLNFAALMPSIPSPKLKPNPKPKTFVSRWKLIAHEWLWICIEGFVCMTLHDFV
jgi:hypothetical protein